MGEDSIFSAGFFEDKIKELHVKSGTHLRIIISVSYSVMKNLNAQKLNVSLQL